MEPKVYVDPQRKRILWTGILVALVVLAAIALGTLSLDRTMKSSGAFTGKIVAKEFTPEPAREITVGAGGLRGADVAGEYLLKVETPDKSRVFNVWVDRTVYEAHEVGDDYYVIPTP
jgi:hypothetical protein